jgi:hypothetical protein
VRIQQVNPGERRLWLSGWTMASSSTPFTDALPALVVSWFGVPPTLTIPDSCRFL